MNILCVTKIKNDLILNCFNSDLIKACIDLKIMCDTVKNVIQSLTLLMVSGT